MRYMRAVYQIIVAYVATTNRTCIYIVFCKSLDKILNNTIQSFKTTFYEMIMNSNDR